MDVFRSCRSVDGRYLWDLVAYNEGVEEEKTISWEVDSIMKV